MICKLAYFNRISSCLFFLLTYISQGKTRAAQNKLIDRNHAIFKQHMPNAVDKPPYLLPTIQFDVLYFPDMWARGVVVRHDTTLHLSLHEVKVGWIVAALAEQVCDFQWYYLI